MYERFAELLGKTDKTVYQVSKDTGIPASTLYMWKRRGGSTSFKNIVILAGYFNVPIDYFKR